MTSQEPPKKEGRIDVKNSSSGSIPSDAENQPPGIMLPPRGARKRDCGPASYSEDNVSYGDIRRRYQGAPIIGEDAVEETYAEIGFEVPEVFTPDPTESYVLTSIEESESYASEGDAEYSDYDTEYDTECECECESESDCDYESEIESEVDEEEEEEEACDEEDEEDCRDDEENDEVAPLGEVQPRESALPVIKLKPVPQLQPLQQENYPRLSLKDRVTMLRMAQAGHSGVQPAGGVALVLPEVPDEKKDVVAIKMQTMAAKKRFPRFFRWRNNRMKSPVRLTETVEW